MKNKRNPAGSEGLAVRRAASQHEKGPVCVGNSERWPGATNNLTNNAQRHGP